VSSEPSLLGDERLDLRATSGTRYLPSGSVSSSSGGGSIGAWGI
jgi:hypothetical protein